MDKINLKILYVEDEVVTRELTAQLLERRVEKLYLAENGREGLDLFLQHDPDIVITDIKMPEMDGLQMSRKIRAAGSDAKIIVTTAYSDVSSLINAIDIGIDSYVVKPVEFNKLLECIRKCSEIIEYRMAGEMYKREREKLIMDLEAALAAKSSLIKKLEYISITDALTGVSNRKHFDDFLSIEWKRAIRNSTHLSLIMFDIDYFKSYNDRYGHVAGDTCLARIARELKNNVRRPADLIARYGGEEFAMVLPETNGKASGIAEKCIRSVEALGIIHEDSTVSRHVTISAGVSSMVPARGSRHSMIIEAADLALYKAKHNGRNRVVLYNGESESGAG